jgi:hypothetical protein
MVRMRGQGDVAAGAPDNFSQAVLNGASDFEFSFVLSPIATSEFAKYAGGAPLANDRTFQVVIQADSNVPQPASGTEGTWTDEFNNDASLINLAYLPAANDLAVWDSSAAGGAGAWQLLGVGPLTGSVDARPVPVVSPVRTLNPTVSATSSSSRRASIRLRPIPTSTASMTSTTTPGMASSTPPRVIPSTGI